jgi:hypothetical protein
MPIVVVGNEKNFAALRPRLFEEKVSSKTAGEVADQVQKANPHADLAKLTPGTVLTIPDSADVRLRGELSLDELTTKELKGVGDHGKALLAGIVTAADEREAKTREERARALESLDSIGTQTKKPREKGLTKELAAARKGLEEEDERAKQRKETLKLAQAEWTEGLDALLQRLG